MHKSVTMKRRMAAVRQGSAVPRLLRISGISRFRKLLTTQTLGRALRGSGDRKRIPHVTRPRQCIICSGSSSKMLHRPSLAKSNLLSLTQGWRELGTGAAVRDNGKARRFGLAHAMQAVKHPEMVIGPRKPRFSVLFVNDAF